VGCPDRSVEPPRVAPGSVVHLEADDWYYGRGADQGQPVQLRVERVPADLARFYDGQQVWVQGHRKTCPLDHPPCRELLVRVSALRQAEGIEGPDSEHVQQSRPGAG
jgi:hypothetical protein